MSTTESRHPLSDELHKEQHTENAVSNCYAVSFVSYLSTLTAFHCNQKLREEVGVSAKSREAEKQTGRVEKTKKKVMIIKTIELWNLCKGRWHQSRHEVSNHIKAEGNDDADADADADDGTMYQNLGDNTVYEWVVIIENVVRRDPLPEKEGHRSITR